MAFLLDAVEEIAAEIFSSVAHLLNLDLDIVFVDSPANRASGSAVVGSRCCVERPQFFFLTADSRCDGLEGLGEVVEAVGECGEGEQFAVPGAVGVDDGAELPVAVAGGAADAAVLGDGAEGDVASGGEQLLAGGADPVDSGVGHDGTTFVWLISTSGAVPPRS